jgi:hypothetical protein
MELYINLDEHACEVVHLKFLQLNIVIDQDVNNGKIGCPFYAQTT